MYAVEFQTIIKNGVIEIPKEHRREFQHSVRVILLAEDIAQTTINLVDQLLSRPLHLENFHPLTREEIHAR